MSEVESFLPVSDPTLIQAHVRDVIRSFETAKGSEQDQLNTARGLYELAIFGKNRQITLEADGLSVVKELLRSTNEEVVAYALSICAQLAGDGADACAALKEVAVHRKALELVCSKTAEVQASAVNLVYWLAQDPESKAFLRNSGAESILSDQAVIAKDIITCKLLNHTINALLPTSKSASELTQLVEDSNLTSSLRSARESLLSGAASGAARTTLADAASLKHELAKSDPTATEAYYSVRAGKEDESEQKVGLEQAPKAEVPMIKDEELQIDQMRITFTLNMPSRRGVSKVLLSGAHQELGRWQPKAALGMWQNARGDWQAELTLPSWLRELEYKYAVVQVKDNKEEFIWESGFIRKFKLSSERMQQVGDTWEGVEGLEDFAPPANRDRAATERATSAPAKDDKRTRTNSAGPGNWRSNYRKM
eukprot:TRINITY_DN8494_c0_g1_i1.p1 TRINITY_DN8494_c0_g1~~TRINITY_DN8494_c0_g1_i1.p1  ORF type:complete len:424 (+),score=128.58 TRINITY_DN8494_c0_g1_i1:121-1392(+)